MTCDPNPFTSTQLRSSCWLCSCSPISAPAVASSHPRPLAAAENQYPPLGQTQRYFHCPYTTLLHLRPQTILSLQGVLLPSPVYALGPTPELVLRPSLSSPTPPSVLKGLCVECICICSPYYFPALLAPAPTRFLRLLLSEGAPSTAHAVSTSRSPRPQC